MKIATIYRTIVWPVLRVICSWTCCGIIGCSIGPKYQRPAVPVAPSYKESGNWKQAEPNDTIVRGHWWELYQDPQLNDLESRVDRGNQTIAAAAANYEAARAIVRQARSQYFPSAHDKSSNHERKSLHRHHSGNHKQGVYILRI